MGIVVFCNHTFVWPSPVGGRQTSDSWNDGPSGQEMLPAEQNRKVKTLSLILTPQQSDFMRRCPNFLHDALKIRICSLVSFVHYAFSTYFDGVSCLMLSVSAFKNFVFRDVFHLIHKSQKKTALETNIFRQRHRCFSGDPPTQPWIY